MSTWTGYVYTHIYVVDMCTKNKMAYRDPGTVSTCKCTVTSERSIFYLKLRILMTIMSFQTSADSFGIHLLGFKCTWWHPRQANDAVEEFLAKTTIIKVFPALRWTHWYLYFGIYMWVVAENYEQIYTHTHGTTTVPLAAHACQRLIMSTNVYLLRV